MSMTFMQAQRGDWNETREAQVSSDSPWLSSSMGHHSRLLSWALPLPSQIQVFHWNLPYGRAGPSSPLIHLTSYLFISMQPHGYELPCMGYYLSGTNGSAHALLQTFIFLVHFLTCWPTDIPGPCPNPAINHFYKELQRLLVENGV